jgi:ABC-2 type transport system permease protein
VVLFNGLAGVVLLFGILVLVNWIARTRFHRFDLTEQQELSLSGATKGVLRGLDDVVVIQAYFSGGIPEVYRSYVDQVKELLFEYEANGRGNVRLEFADPSEDPGVEELVRGLGIEAGRFASIRKDRQVVELLYAAIGVFYRDRYEAINLASFQAHTWSRVLEFELTRALVKVSSGKPVVVGLMAETDPAPEPGRPPRSREPQFRELREQILKQLDVVDVDVRDGSPVPEEVDTLLVVRPKGISEREKYEIDQFLMRGGKLLFLVDRYGPSTSNPAQAETIDPGILDLLEHYGVAVEPGLVKDTECNRLTVQRQLRDAQGKVVTFLPVQVRYPYSLRVVEERLDRTNPMVSTMEAISFLWASPLRLVSDRTVGKRVWELARSSEESWLDAEPGDLSPETTPPESPANAETGSRLLAAALVGKFESYYADREIPRTSAEIEADAEAASDTGSEGAEEGAGEGGGEDPEGAEEPAKDSREGRTTLDESPSTRILVVGDADFVADAVAQAQRQAFVEGMIFVLNAVDWFTVREELIEIRSRGFVDRSLGEISDATRRWTKILNIAGVPLLVVLFGIFRFVSRGRGRKRLAPRSRTAGVAS